MQLTAFVARYRAWVDAASARDARRSNGVVFVRAWLFQGLLWGTLMTGWRVVLAPEQGLTRATLGEAATQYLTTGLLFFGPIMAALRVAHVARSRNRQVRRPSEP